MQEHVVLIGAGSASFTRGLLADFIRRNQPLTLSLVDIDAENLATAEGLAKKMIGAKGAPITLRAAVDRRKVLRGATAVICTVGVGGRRAWEQDVFIPRKYGIYQPVGDSVMPGGSSRALRMIPAMVDVARDVLELAPSALFFNYGNPMAPVCRAIRKATGARVVGLCHGVPSVERYLAHMLGVESKRLAYTAIGMNHLTWFMNISVDGRDAHSRLREVAVAQLAKVTENAPGVEHLQPFSWQLFQLFDAFPAVLDRHASEFFTQFFTGKGSYFGKTLGVDAFSLEECTAGGDAIYAQMAADARAPEPLRDDYFAQFGGEHEQVVDIIDSIRADSGEIYSANLPNSGQVPNLPLEAVIECPAQAHANGLRALPQQPLPAGIAGTLATRFQWVETIVEAALEGSREKFIQALVLDGAVHSLDTAAALADDLLDVQAAFLPQFRRG